jgi:hypothetical protein
MTIVAFVLAITQALLSVFVERSGPELVQYGNLCGLTGSDPCYKPALKGGFPFAYLSDSPGVSMENQLSFVEDQLFSGALALNIAVYFAFMLLLLLVISRYRDAFRSAAAHGGA